ncbi:MAG: hypothetical protein IV090_19840 [Candidatus Sericytochromatia bacterium]|nr:hypothetical protein [Candidatus Sericytochromatia bacterium]
MKIEIKPHAQETALKLQRLLDMSERTAVDLSKYAGLYREVAVTAGFVGPARSHGTTKTTRLVADLEAIAAKLTAKSTACYLEV